MPGLARIAWREIERRRERAGVPRLVLDAALALPSTDGRSYRERIDSARTERDLSETYEDMIGRVPLAARFLAERNPVRTAGPMQVGIAFAQAEARERRYPYPVGGGIRHEVFTRRGGLYFGIAHLLAYEAPYEAMRYRFADYNAGRYASRNAAFQQALGRLAGRALALDGDLEPGEPGRAGETEAAVLALAPRLGMDAGRIRRELALGRGAAFGRSEVYARVFALADVAAGKRVSRSEVPRIALDTPKTARRLTTAWFARSVERRYRACLGGAPAS